MMPEDAQVRQIAYATSGEQTGDWGNSVSYVGMVVTSPIAFSGVFALQSGHSRAISAGDLVLLHRLAVLGVEQAVLGTSRQRHAAIEKVLKTLPENLKRPSGAFVTLKRGDHLRGCIGYIQPRKPLVQAVLENSVNAARNDWRFQPVGPGELGDLEIEVSVLSPPRPIDSYDEFLVGEQGVILHKDGRQAVFLPEVAVERGWTRDDTLSYLARKAGLAEDAWREGATFEVFTSVKYAAPYPAQEGANRSPATDHHGESMPGSATDS
jgi:AmmeMemoRadiSam system protein A